jgi:hypothetical protein
VLHSRKKKNKKNIEVVGTPRTTKNLFIVFPYKMGVCSGSRSAVQARTKTKNLILKKEGE